MESVPIGLIEPRSDIQLRPRFLFGLYILAMIVAVINGAFLIEAAIYPAASKLSSSKTSAGSYDEQEKQLLFFQVSSAVCGSLTLIFSLFFVWSAIDLGIIIFCGKNRQNHCLYDKTVKDEMRQLLLKYTK